MFDFEDWYQNVASRYCYRWEFMRHSGLFREHCQNVLLFNEIQRIFLGPSSNFTDADWGLFQVWNLPNIPNPLDHARLYHLPTLKELLQGWMDDLVNSEKTPSAIIRGKTPDHKRLLLNLAKKLNEPGNHVQPLMRVAGPFERDNSISLYICSPLPIDLAAFKAQLEKSDHPISVAEIWGEDSGNFVYIRLNLPGLPMKPSGVDDQAFKQEAIKKIAPLVHAVEKALSFKKLVNSPVTIFDERETTKHLDDQLKALACQAAPEKEKDVSASNVSRTLKAAQEKVARLEQRAAARLKLFVS